MDAFRTSRCIYRHWLVVLIGRFSRDTQYISDILKSMEQAEKENFAPVAIAGHNPEFDAIVRGLNDLYTNLENLIQREYKLTISQQKAQMDMLSAQLSPHFLYNTLERIRMRAVIDNAQDVAEATAGLAQYREDRACDYDAAGTGDYRAISGFDDLSLWRPVHVLLRCGSRAGTDADP